MPDFSKYRNNLSGQSMSANDKTSLKRVNPSLAEADTTRKKYTPSGFGDGDIVLAQRAADDALRDKKIKAGIHDFHSGFNDNYIQKIINPGTNNYQPFSNSRYALQSQNDYKDITEDEYNEALQSQLKANGLDDETPFADENQANGYYEPIAKRIKQEAMSKSPYYRYYFGKKGAISFNNEDWAKIDAEYKAIQQLRGPEVAKMWLNQIIKNNISDNQTTLEKLGRGFTQMGQDAYSSFITLGGFVYGLVTPQEKQNDIDANWFKRRLLNGINNEVTRYAQDVRNTGQFTRKDIQNMKDYYDGLNSSEIVSDDEEDQTIFNDDTISNLIGQQGFTVASTVLSFGAGLLASAGKKILKKAILASAKKEGRSLVANATRQQLANVNRVTRWTDGIFIVGASSAPESVMEALDAGQQVEKEGRLAIDSVHQQEAFEQTNALALDIINNGGKISQDEYGNTHLITADGNEINLEEIYNSTLAGLSSREEDEDKLAEEMSDVMVRNYITNQAINGVIMATCKQALMSDKARSMVQKAFKPNFTVNGTTVTPVKKVVKNIWRYLSAMFGEGVEEYTQALSSSTWQGAADNEMINYLNNKYSTEGAQLVADEIGSNFSGALKAFGDTAVDKQTLKEFVYGALGGIGGSVARPQFSKINADGTSTSYFGARREGETTLDAILRNVNGVRMATPWQTSIGAAINEQMSERERAEYVAKQISAVLQDPEMVGKLQDAGSMADLLKQMSEESLNGNGMNVRDSKSAAFIKMAFLLQNIQDSEYYSKFMDTLNILSAVDENSAYRENVLKDMLARYPEMSEEEALQTVRDNAGKVLSMLSQTQEISNDVDEIFGDNLSVDVKEALVYGLAMEYQRQARVDQLSGEIGHIPAPESTIDNGIAVTNKNTALIDQIIRLGGVEAAQKWYNSLDGKIKSKEDLLKLRQELKSDKKTINRIKEEIKSLKEQKKKYADLMKLDKAAVFSESDIASMSDEQKALLLANAKQDIYNSRHTRFNDENGQENGQESEQTEESEQSNNSFYNEEQTRIIDNYLANAEKADKDYLEKQIDLGSLKASIGTFRQQFEETIKDRSGLTRYASAVKENQRRFALQQRIDELKNVDDYKTFENLLNNILDGGDMTTQFMAYQTLNGNENFAEYNKRKGDRANIINAIQKNDQLFNADPNSLFLLDAALRYAQDEGVDINNQEEFIAKLQETKDNGVLKVYDYIQDLNKKLPNEYKTVFSSVEDIISLYNKAKGFVDNEAAEQARTELHPDSQQPVDDITQPQQPTTPVEEPQQPQEEPGMQEEQQPQQPVEPAEPNFREEEKPQLPPAIERPAQHREGEKPTGNNEASNENVFNNRKKNAYTGKPFNPNSSNMQTLSYQYMKENYPDSPIVKYLEDAGVANAISSGNLTVNTPVYFYHDAELTKQVMESMGEKYNDNNISILAVVETNDKSKIKIGDKYYQVIGMMPVNSESNANYYSGVTHSGYLRNFATEQTGLLRDSKGNPLKGKVNDVYRQPSVPQNTGIIDAILAELQPSEIERLKRLSKEELKNDPVFRDLVQRKVKNLTNDNLNQAYDEFTGYKSKLPVGLQERTKDGNSYTISLMENSIDKTVDRNTGKTIEQLLNDNDFKAFLKTNFRIAQVAKNLHGNMKELSSIKQSDYSIDANGSISLSDSAKETIKSVENSLFYALKGNLTITDGGHFRLTPIITEGGALSFNLSLVNNANAEIANLGEYSSTTLDNEYGKFNFFKKLLVDENGNIRKNSRGGTLVKWQIDYKPVGFVASNIEPIEGTTKSRVTFRFTKKGAETPSTFILGEYENTDLSNLNIIAEIYKNIDKIQPEDSFTEEADIKESKKQIKANIEQWRRSFENSIYDELVISQNTGIGFYGQGVSIQSPFKSDGTVADEVSYNNRQNNSPTVDDNSRTQTPQGKVDTDTGIVVEPQEQKPVNQKGQDAAVKTEAEKKLDAMRDGTKQFQKTNEIGVTSMLRDDTVESNTSKVATTIGNSVDTFVRDYFNGKISLDEVQSKYHLDRKQAEAFIKQLDDAKAYMESDLGFTLVTGDEISIRTNMTVIKDGRQITIPSVGVTDLVAIDRNGNFHIIDIKTTNSKISPNTLHKYAIQVANYRNGMEATYKDQNVTVAGVHILEIGVNYNGKNDSNTHIDENTGQMIHSNYEFNTWGPKVRMFHQNVDRGLTQSDTFRYEDLATSIQERVDAIESSRQEDRQDETITPTPQPAPIIDEAYVERKAHDYSVNLPSGIENDIMDQDLYDENSELYEQLEGMSAEERRKFISEHIKEFVNQIYTKDEWDALPDEAKINQIRCCL